MSFKDFKKRIPKVIFENPDELISGGEHQKLLLDGVDLVEAELNKKADSTDVETELGKKVDSTSFDEYKKGQELVDKSKVDKTVYEEDLASLEEYKESQSELNAKQDIGINKNLQNINQLNDTIKLLSQKDEPIMTANGGNIISLPNNAMKSVVPSYKIEGLTLTNLVKNGDFSDGTTGWKLPASSTGAISAANNELIVTGGAVRVFQIISQPIGNGDVCYVKADVLRESLVDGSVRLIWNGVDNGESSYVQEVIKEEIPPNVYTTLKGRFTRNFNDNNTGNVRIQIQNWSSEDVTALKIKNVLLFNLTQTFGAGNEPTKEWCDEHISGYFEGTKSVTAPLRIKSEIGGRNLLTRSGGSDVSEAKYWTTTNYNYVSIDNDNLAKYTIRESSGAGRLERVLDLESGNYTVSIWLKGDLIIDYRSFVGAGVLNQYKDRDGDYIIFRAYFKVPVSTQVIIRAYYGDGLKEGDEFFAKYFKLEKGNKATPWTPAPEDNQPATGGTLYINNNLELKSVGKVKDYIENGKLYKNVHKYVFDGTERWVKRIEENIDGTDVIKYSVDLDIPKYSIDAHLSLVSSLNVNRKGSGGAIGGDLDIYQIALWSGITPHNSVYLTVKKGDNINNIVKGHFIQYVLDETEIINLSTSGNLTTHPNGTIIIEPATNVTAYYNDGLDVSKFNIESVGEFAVFKDGNYQSLDVSKIEITDNKLTHPDAINGLCYLVYRYDNNPIFGDNEVEYYNNDGILVSPDGTFWKPVLTVDDEGNILMKGEKL